MAEYSSIERLQQDLLDAGLPVAGIAHVNREEEGWWVCKRPDGVWVRVDWATPPTVAEGDEAEGIILAFELGTMVPRDLDALVADLDALDTGQKNNLGDYITGTVPLPGGRNGPRWRLSNQGEVWTCFRLAPFLTTAAALQMRLLGVASIVRNEQPKLLVNPPWDPSINVPGWEVAPEG